MLRSGAYFTPPWTITFAGTVEVMPPLLYDVVSLPPLVALAVALHTVRRDTVPRPIMSARDSLCIFEMCLEGRFDEAEEAVGRFTDL